MEVAAWIAAVLIGVVMVFQLALALGAPAGAASWGGSHPGVLPTRLRVASGIVAVFFYPVVAIELLNAGGVIEVGWDIGPLWIWLLSGLFALGALANLASKSRIEKLWAPVSLAIAICCAVIAINM